MIVVCESCGQKNRVPPARLPKAGTCGRCKASLKSPHQPIDVDVATFDKVLAESPLPVLVDFWAPWCGPCVRAAPEVAAAAAQLAGKALVLKVDTQRYPELSQRFGIKGIPYFAVFEGGQRVREQTGLVDARRLVGLVGG